MSTRIRWTEQERQEVIDKAVEVYDRGNVSHLEALRVAQNLTLATARLRTFATHSAAKIEIKQLKDAYGKSLQAGIKREASKQEAKVSNTLTVSGPPVPPVVQQSALDAVSMEDLIGEIAKRIASSLTTAIHHEIKELEHSFKVPKHDPTYESTGLFKKRIVIVGLLPDQEQAITRDFSDRFALKFLGNEMAKHADIPTADAYLLMKSFISHAVFNKYQPLPGHVLIDGGMSTLRMWLNTKGAEL